jgi:hypothetical protein
VNRLLAQRFQIQTANKKDARIQALVSTFSGQRTVSSESGAASFNSQLTRGLKPGRDENEIMRDTTLDEDVGDLKRPVGMIAGNVVGISIGALAKINIFSTTHGGPVWKRHGIFEWDVSFNTTGRSGWIVQEIVNTFRATNDEGKPLVNLTTPHFWEAWAVDGAGKVTPKVGKYNDHWENPKFHLAGAVEGHWSTTAKLYFTTINPASQGFIRNNPDTNAKELLSSTKEPSGLGIPLFYRFAQGHWDTTKGIRHTGLAGPG